MVVVVDILIEWDRKVKQVSGARFSSLRGKLSKGKGKGIRAQDHAQGRREEGGGEGFLSFLPRVPHALSPAQIPPSPSPSPFNACLAG